MIIRRIRRGLALLLMLCLAIPVAAAYADEDDAAQVAAYWQIVGDSAGDEPLARAMRGEYTALPPAEKAAAAAELKGITADELLAFAAMYRLPVDMARHAWYTALADCLTAEISLGEASPTEEILALFLAMKENPRDSQANQERRQLHKGLTEADIRAYAAETGLPAGFVAWLMLDDEWYEPDWEDSDDWREGRRDWQIPDWVDASDLQARYGREAVVTEDDVERTLRQNGYRFDD